MSAARLLAEARAAGVVLRLEEGRIRLRAVRELPADLLTRLCAQKAELVQLLRGERCRRCGEVIVDQRPGWIAFAAGSAAHVSCDDAWKLERTRASAASRVAPEALAGPADAPL